MGQDVIARDQVHHHGRVEIGIVGAERASRVSLVIQRHGSCALRVCPHQKLCAVRVRPARHESALHAGAITCRSISPTLLTPHSAMVTSSSLRMNSIACATPGCAAGAEAEDVGAADQARARAERERAHEVLPGADAAVEHHLDVGADRIDDLRQRRDRGRRAVELTAAVVGDHDRARAGLGREPRVLDIEHALEDELARPQAPDPLDVLPGERRIELRRDPRRQRLHIGAAADVAGEIAEGLALAAQHAERPASAWSRCRSRS